METGNKKAYSLLADIYGSEAYYDKDKSHNKNLFSTFPISQYIIVSFQQQQNHKSYKEINVCIIFELVCIY